MDRTFGSVKIADSYRKKCLVWGTALAGCAVVLGALGAHALQRNLTAAQMGSFETAVRFQFLHALALLALAAVPQLWQPHAGVRKLLSWGTVCFSFSIYVLLALPEGHGLRSVAGPITPVGGVLLILGWGWWMLSTIRTKGVR